MMEDRWLSADEVADYLNVKKIQSINGSKPKTFPLTDSAMSGSSA
jgi:hypothetical protein